MPTKRTNIPTSTTKTVDNLKPAWSYADMARDLWADVESKLIVYPEYNPGTDITKRDWAQHFNVSDAGADKQMKSIAKQNPNEYEMIKVRHPARSQVILVLRKKTS